MFGKKELPTSEAHFRKWSQIRSRGEVRFLFARGVLPAVVCEILSFFIIGIWYEHKRFDGLWNYVLGNGIGWLVAGFYAGVSEWNSNEKQYGRELLQFSTSNYETQEQTLKQLQRGIEKGR